MNCTGTGNCNNFNNNTALVFPISPLQANKVILCILAPGCSCCREAVNVVPMSGSERVLEVHFLHLIRVDYSVPQPCSRQSHTKGGPAPVCTGALWSEGSRISLHTDRSKPACQPPHTLSFHFSLIGFGVEGHVWCVNMCTCLGACGVVRWGGVCVWGVGLPLPLNHGGPWGSYSHSGGCSWPPLSLNQSAAFFAPLLPTLSPSLVALITLHVPCPFNLATKGRQAGEARN